MSSQYTGNPTATQSPAPTPALGNYPIEVLPADGDALNASSVAQAFKVCADFIAFIQLAISKILTTTYSMLGLVVDGTGEQTVSPVAGQVSVSRSSFIYDPLLVFKDVGGTEVRWLVDHNGFPMSKCSRIETNWNFGPTLSAGATASLGGDGTWLGVSSANATVGVVAPSSAYYSTAAIIHTVTTSTNYGVITTQNVPTVWGANTSFVMEFDFALSNASNTNTSSWVIGLVGGAGNPSGSGTQNSLCFQKASTDTFWWTQESNFGGSLNVTNNVVTPVSGVFNQFRIEYHGASTPIGIAATAGCLANTAKGLFFIDGTFIGAYSSTDTHFPTSSGNQMAPYFGGVATASNTTTGTLGNVRCVWTLFLSPPSL